MKFILGKKLNMTQVFKDNGDVVPVTAVFAEPNVVTQVKNKDPEGYTAIQVGFSRTKKINKTQGGHLKGLESLKTVKEFRVDAEEAGSLKRGDTISVDVFEPGDGVKVVGKSKGKGFQGVVRRHGFHGAPASHGHKDQERMGGSIGATDAARVFKGMKMPGQMGDKQVTVTGLEIIDVDSEKNILYVKGAVPGARNGLLLISGAGEMKLQESKDGDEKKEVKAKVKAEAPIAEEAPKETAPKAEAKEPAPAKVPTSEAEKKEAK